MRLPSVLFIVMFLPGFLFAKINPDTLASGDTISLESIYSGIPLPEDSSAASGHKSKKLIAAILSFPLPFGILGLHRIILGTKPYMPFVYIGTLGGCFGILPLIDFIAILSSKEEKMRSYFNNPKVFMWAK